MMQTLSRRSFTEHQQDIIWSMYSMDNNMRAELVNRALLNAMWQRKQPAGLV